VPVSSLGREYFRYDEGARALVGEDTGTRYAVGDILELKLGEANPLSGALKFEVIDADGGKPIEPRGSRPEPKKSRGRQGQRGRPGNIRHQGRPSRR
ncbi:MAG TPA: ribonuclease R, partial [Croceibacterium sp.]|nr:ribonuclease R [Croceibacterium sp.]